MPRLTIEAAAETWPLARPFVISRGAKTAAEVVVVHVHEDGITGRGESVPYARYGETPAAVVAAIRAVGTVRDRRDLLLRLPPGAARNALDCALWDLEAKRTGRRAALAAGAGPLTPVQTALTLSLGPPEAMAAEARACAGHTLLKLKLGGADDPQRMQAVREARPDARLLADANEAWRPEQVAEFLSAAAAAGVELVEQPLPAGADLALRGARRDVTLCADESAHTAADLAGLRDRYQAVNIKLDKAGGLTHALEMAAEARRLGFRIMTGSMVGTSLSMAPAFLLAQRADWADLDSPLLLARDRDGGLAISGTGWISPPSPALWG